MMTPTPIPTLPALLQAHLNAHGARLHQPRRGHLTLKSEVGKEFPAGVLHDLIDAAPAAHLPQLLTLLGPGAGLLVNPSGNFAGSRLPASLLRSRDPLTAALRLPGGMHVPPLPAKFKLGDAGADPVCVNAMLLERLSRSAMVRLGVDAEAQEKYGWPVTLTGLAVRITLQRLGLESPGHAAPFLSEDNLENQVINTVQFGFIGFRNQVNEQQYEPGRHWIINTPELMAHVHRTLAELLLRRKGPERSWDVLSTYMNVPVIYTRCGTLLLANMAAVNMVRAQGRLIEEGQAAMRSINLWPTRSGVGVKVCQISGRYARQGQALRWIHLPDQRLVFRPVGMQVMTLSEMIGSRHKLRVWENSTTKKGEFRQDQATGLDCVRGTCDRPLKPEELALVTAGFPQGHPLRTLAETGGNVQAFADLAAKLSSEHEETVNRRKTELSRRRRERLAAKRKAAGEPEETDELMEFPPENDLPF